jgi:predicted RNA polymerase sigma factor
MAALFEIDELKQEKLPDGRLRVVFVTSGLHPDLARIKTVLWALSAVPPQLVDSMEVEELQSGVIVKRYQVVATLRSLIGGRREKERGRGEG